MNEQPVIVGPNGQPARAAVSANCPRCGKGPDRRVASGGFGTLHPVCGHCGYEWHEERWNG